MYNKAKFFAESKGYNTMQDFIRKTLFEEKETITRLNTYLASEQSLAKNWLTKEEEKAWNYLQKEN
ncbi:MAG: hypothetical protein ACMXX6_01275 [Candidatus Woesearchaeota archaeon]